MLVRRSPVYDHQQTAIFVFDSGRRLGVKISSSHSTSGIETFRCQALAQRKESFTTTRFLEVQLQLLNLKSAVARKQKQEPARQNGPS